ncbi:MAG: AIR synthase-related protein, partial [Bacillota bacterium]|nr:AIR synthase-related protein [Bacillota bacterium]
METLAEELLQRPLKPLERALLEVVWSEHCSYRQSRDRLRLFPTQGPQVRVGPGEGAGAVAWEGPLSLAFRLESHNHPSASAPWEGAATGAGGILRDLVSIGARPLFLGAALSLPPFPSPLEEGIREGLSHYARQLNLPVPLLTVQRSKAFAEKPLVNVLAVGVRHEEKALSARGAYPGARLLLVGKEVDGLGLGAAAAASRAGEPFAASVPSSDPLLGQQVLRLTLDLGERGLLLALQDLGAGGLGGAAWELALKNGCGVSLDLEKVPAVPQARDPFSLLLAETQERMLYAVAPEIREDVLDLARQAGLPAADVGAFTSDPIFLALWEGEALAALALPPLREGPPPRLWPACEETIALSRRERTFFFSPHPFTIGETGGAALLVQGEHHLKREPLGETFFLLVTAALSLALGGFAPWGISNSLNLGDMEEGSTQRAFLSVTEGIARGGRLLGLPVVSGN